MPYILAAMIALIVAMSGLHTNIQEQSLSFGAVTPFTSKQLAPSPGAGECLTTDGTDNDWAACGGGGLSGGTAGMIPAWTSSSALTSTSSVTATSFYATSSAATSTFLGGLDISSSLGPKLRINTATLNPTFRTGILFDENNTASMGILYNGAGSTGNNYISIADMFTPNVNLFKFHRSGTSSIPYASTTGMTLGILDLTGTLTFNGVTGTTWASFCTTITGAAALCDGDDATGAGGGAYPFTPASTFGTTTSATTSSLWTQGVFFSSSTKAASQFPYASSTALTAGNLFSDTLTLTNALTVANGGSGATSLTGVLIGNGTGAFTADAVPLSIANGGTNNTSAYSAGGIIFSDGTSLVQAASLSPFYDQSNDRLGVADTSPDFRFETVGTNGSGYFGVTSGAGEGNIFIIGPTGLVGIGTTTPAAQLGVNGTIFAGRLISTSTMASVIPYASSTALSASNLTSGNCLQASTGGFITDTGSACGSGAGGNTSKWATTTGAYTGIIPNGGTNVAVGVGTTTPWWALQVSSSSRPQLALSDGSVTSDIWTMRNAGGNLYISTSSPATLATSTLPAISVLKDGQGLFYGTSTNSSVTGMAIEGTVVLGSLTQATGGTAADLCIIAGTNNLIEESTGACIVSSRVFKHGIESLDVTALDIIQKLRPTTFIMNDDVTETRKAGFIAEEAYDVDPKLALKGSKGEVRSLDDHAFLAVLWKGVQELLAKITGLEQRLNEQESTIKSLEVRLERAGL